MENICFLVNLDDLVDEDAYFQGSKHPGSGSSFKLLQHLPPVLGVAI